MLIKARPVAGDVELATEFLEMIQPFRYPRSISERILQEIAAMKERIENEVVKAARSIATSNSVAAAFAKSNSSPKRCRSCMPDTHLFCKARKPCRRCKNSVEYQHLKASEVEELTERICFCAISSIACRWKRISKRTRFQPSAKPANVSRG